MKLRNRFISSTAGNDRDAPTAPASKLPRNRKRKAEQGQEAPAGTAGPGVNDDMASQASVLPDHGSACASPLKPGGLTSDMASKLDDIVQYLLTLQGGYIFASPVDPVALKLWDYSDIIKQPMDLGTIRKKIKGNGYLSIEDFKSENLLNFESLTKVQKFWFSASASDDCRHSVMRA